MTTSHYLQENVPWRFPEEFCFRLIGFYFFKNNLNVLKQALLLDASKWTEPNLRENKRLALYTNLQTLRDCEIKQHDCWSRGFTGP